MSIEESIGIVILLSNSLLSLCYLIWGVFILPYRKKIKSQEPVGKVKYFIIFVIMLLCPVVGALFFIMGTLFFRMFFHKEVDLSEVIFSKERVVVTEKADLKSGINIVPLEEAIAISDYKSLRTLMMNVIKGDVQKSLATISLALNSEDSETSHYAASVLRDELNDFRENVQRILVEISKEEDNQTEYCRMLLDYMNGILVQKIFIEMEQEYFVHKMVEASEILYQKDKKSLESKYFEWTCLRLLEIGDFALSELWCTRATELYPKKLFPYTCQLKLYFTTMEKEKFFQTLESLKKSNIVIDKETLELIRIFS